MAGGVLLSIFNYKTQTDLPGTYRPDVGGAGPSSSGAGIGELREWFLCRVVKRRLPQECRRLLDDIDLYGSVLSVICRLGMGGVNDDG
jgi:hypothetical protein